MKKYLFKTKFYKTTISVSVAAINAINAIVGSEINAIVLFLDSAVKSRLLEITLPL